MGVILSKWGYFRLSIFYLAWWGFDKSKMYLEKLEDQFG
jgi:hypothetical protein